MSQKYPEGAIIVSKNKDYRYKVAEQISLFYFLEGITTRSARIASQYELESEGWTVEETPWVPKEGEVWEFVRENGKVDMTEWSETDPYCLKMKEVGNCYEPGTGEIAASRVLRAYKGEK